MKRKIYIVLPAILIFACAAPITMMNTERHPINHYTNLEVLEFQNDVIGEINTFIMNKIMEKSIRGIVKLERFEKVSISPKIETNDEYILSNTSSADEAGDNLENTAVLEVILREYKKGNAFVRFLFGALAGSGSVTCDLVVLDKKTSKTMMRAQTTAKIVGAYSSENDVIVPLYIIKKYKIASVQDSGNDVSWDELLKKKYKKVNYNSYSNFVRIR